MKNLHQIRKFQCCWFYLCRHHKINKKQSIFSARKYRFSKKKVIKKYHFFSFYKPINLSRKVILKHLWILSMVIARWFYDIRDHQDWSLFFVFFLLWRENFNGKKCSFFSFEWNFYPKFSSSGDGWIWSESTKKNQVKKKVKSINKNQKKNVEIHQSIIHLFMVDWKTKILNKLLWLFFWLLSFWLKFQKIKKNSIKVKVDLKWIAEEVEKDFCFQMLSVSMSFVS